MKSDDSADSVDRAFAKINLSTARRHVFLCVGPDCCTSERGLVVWEHLKHLLKAHHVPILRTKAACLRICCGGPWMLVYPEGVWYGAVTVERCERIVTEHLLGNRVVTEWIAQKHPLSSVE